MSVFPVTLPLYPILNASEAVEKLLEKDAEAAKAWPSDEKADAETAEVDTAIRDADRPAHQINAVEGAAAVVAMPIARSGAEQLVAAEVVDAKDAEHVEPSDARVAEDGYARQSEAVRSEEETTQTAKAEAEEDEPASPRLDKRT